MQTVSELWNTLLADETAWMETKAVINDVEYTAISNPVINSALMQNGLSIGNAVSASCQFSVQTDNEIPRSAEVVIKCRLTNGTQESEWLTKGTFYISHRTVDPVTGIISLECYDSLLKANADMPSLAPWTNEDGEVITTENGDWIYFPQNYPRSMESVLYDIAYFIGVELDERTVINTGANYTIDKVDAGTSVHDVLCKIAFANGGNWIITPDNKLRLVPLVSADNAASATEDVIEVDGVIGAIGVSTYGTITGIRYVTDDNEKHVVGDETGIVLDADVSPEIAQVLYTAYGGYTYQSYSLNGSIYNPAVELGDYVNRFDNIHSMLCVESATLGINYRGNISAPEPGEISDEFPYVGGSAKTLVLAKTYADETVQEFGNSLDQQSVFNRLTNNGAAQGIYLDNNGNLYINGTYINSGTINANLIRAGMIADASGKNYWILSGNSSEFVTRKGIIGDFTLEDGAMQYGVMAPGGQGAYVGKDGITYFDTRDDTAQGVPHNFVKVQMYSLGIKMYWDNTLRTVLQNRDGGLHIATYDLQGNLNWPLQIWNSTTRVIYHRFFTRFLEDFYCEGNVVFLKNLRVDGDLTVNGTKNRVVDTEQYSKRLMYSYETSSPMFGDVGEGVICDDGLCYITIDPVFAQTISTDQYQVFLQKYGNGDVWVKERKGGYFIVEGTPGIAFGWEIKARQRDFDQRRMDVFSEKEHEEKTDYADMAAQYVERLKKERVSE